MPLSAHFPALKTLATFRRTEPRTCYWHEQQKSVKGFVSQKQFYVRAKPSLGRVFSLFSTSWVVWGQSAFDRSCHGGLTALPLEFSTSIFFQIIYNCRQKGTSAKKWLRLVVPRAVTTDASLTPRRGTTVQINIKTINRHEISPSLLHMTQKVQDLVTRFVLISLGRIV